MWFKKILITFLYFLLGISFLNAQTNTIKDFNQDGIKDTIRYEFYNEHYGEQIHIYDLEFIDGETQNRYPFYASEYSKSDFISIISIPDFLMEKRNKEALDVARELLVPRFNHSDLNPSLEWLVEAYNANESLEVNLYFDRRMQLGLKWNELPIQKPEVSYHLIDSTTLQLPEFYYPEKKSKYAWLSYYRHNHNDQFKNQLYEEIQINKSTTLLTTQHGLILKKENRYTWLFHSNATLTGGPDKLRWKSIEDVLINKEYIIIHHVSPVVGFNRIFVINSKTGKVGKIKLDDWFAGNNPSRVDIDFIKDELYISYKIEWDEDEDGNMYELRVFELKTLFEELEKL